MGFDDLWVLWLLPLAALPLLAPSGVALSNGWLAVAPRDRASSVIGWALRSAMALALAALILALAGPFRPETTIERIGQGAEIVLVLDRSRSMDQGFAPNSSPPPNARGNGPEVLNYYMTMRPRESKGQVARRLLAEFTRQRPDDRFAMVVFSTLPIRVLDFTQRPEAVQAAIAAGNVGRGLSETNIGRALDAALDPFEGRPYTGSRIVMLVSDGGDRLDPDTRELLAHRLRKLRVSIYWIYLRSVNSPGLTPQAGDAASAESVPEMLLHRRLQGLPTPYRAYEAADAQALQRAIDDVNRLEKLPIAHDELIPRRELAPWGHGVALLALMLLLGARCVEVRRWS